MSTAQRRRKRKRREVGAVDVVEEAFHLVRTAGMGSFLLYYAGGVPWAMGMLYFAADMSRSSLAGRDAAFAAAAMTGLWLWKRFCQAAFCARLWDRLSPGHLPALGAGGRLRALSALWFAQAFRLPFVALGLFFALPLGWILAFFQNLNALALTQAPSDRPLRTLVGRSIRFSHDQWAQNHGVLLIFFLVSLFTWINLVASCMVLPTLVKAIFGIESLFTISPMVAVTNTTFLLGTWLLMQLVIDPLFNAAYVLRCFHASSLDTGADLLSRLASCRRRREIEDSRDRGMLGKVAAAVLLVAAGLASTGRAEEAAPAAVEVSQSERFRGEISETLEQKKYQWQFSRRGTDAEELAGDSWLGQRLEEIAESAKRLFKLIGDWIEEAARRAFERNRPSRAAEGDSDFFQRLGSTTSLVLVALIAGVVVWFLVILYRKYRGKEKVEEVEDVPSGAIDLSSEDIVATQLHEDEWLRLAREQIEKGEERLAIRALFLATLAHLGERGLLKIARSKSNRDYRGELGLRARSLGNLRRAFDENTDLFEEVWYGLHRLGSGAVEDYLRNHGLIAEDSAKARATTPGN